MKEKTAENFVLEEFAAFLSLLLLSEKKLAYFYFIELLTGKN